MSLSARGASWLGFVARLLLVVLAGGLAMHVGRRLSLAVAPTLVAAARPAALLAFYAVGLTAQPLFWLDGLLGWDRVKEGWQSRRWAFVVPALCFCMALGFTGIQAVSRFTSMRYATEAAPGWDALSATGEWFVYAASIAVGLAVEVWLGHLSKQSGQARGLRQRALVVLGLNVAGLVFAGVVATLV